MKVNRDVEAVEVAGDEAKGVSMKILVGPRDGSERIIMRLFTVAPGGHTPRHRHDWEHLVRIERGRAVVLDGSGAEHQIAAGASVFIPANEEHQFRNPGDEPVEFICVIPNPEQAQGDGRS